MIKSLELFDRQSCWNRAADKEPVFVLLGRDITAPAVIREWARLRCLHGKNTPRDRQICEALALADGMECYQKGLHGGDNARTSPEGNNSPAPPSKPVRPAWRVTVKRGRDRRVLVFEDLPNGYEKGDTVYLPAAGQPKGGGALELWTVTKIEKTEILARIPR